MLLSFLLLLTVELLDPIGEAHKEDQLRRKINFNFRAFSCFFFLPFFLSFFCSHRGIFSDARNDLSVPLIVIVYTSGVLSSYFRDLILPTLCQTAAVTATMAAKSVNAVPCSNSVTHFSPGSFATFPNSHFFFLSFFLCGNLRDRFYSGKKKAE